MALGAEGTLHFWIPQDTVHQEAVLYWLFLLAQHGGVGKNAALVSPWEEQKCVSDIPTCITAAKKGFQLNCICQLTYQAISCLLQVQMSMWEFPCLWSTDYIWHTLGSWRQQRTKARIWKSAEALEPGESQCRLRILSLYSSGILAWTFLFL